MEKMGKFILTVIIWALCAGISITALLSSNGNINGDIVAVISIPLVAATFSMAALWTGGESTAPESGSTATGGESGEKAKRDSTRYPSKLALLMEMMDDDEREAFKDALKQRILEDASVGDDGEWSPDAMSLESLLDEAESDNACAASAAPRALER